jgi:hypothetical protein
MECGDFEGRKSLGLLGLVAFLGGVVSIGACCKHHVCCRHDQHCEGNCKRCHGHGHEDRHGRGASEGYGRGSERCQIDPMSILDKRFAAGEIDEDEYKRRRDVLKENL